MSTAVIFISLDADLTMEYRFADRSRMRDFLQLKKVDRDENYRGLSSGSVKQGIQWINDWIEYFTHRDEIGKEEIRALQKMVKTLSLLNEIRWITINIS